MRVIRFTEFLLFSATMFFAAIFFAAIGLAFCWLPTASTFAQEPSESSQLASEEQATDAELAQPADVARIEKLAKYLTNSRWKGKFTLSNVDRPPTAETYEITQAEKAENGDYWNLVARIKYADHDVTLPLPPIEIKWAGGTPVITVDQITIPSLGTFDARVLIRGGQYAGTWSHDQVGGHLFGTIEKIEEEK